MSGAARVVDRLAADRFLLGLLLGYVEHFAPLGVGKARTLG